MAEDNLYPFSEVRAFNIVYSSSFYYGDLLLGASLQDKR